MIGQRQLAVCSTEVQVAAVFFPIPCHTSSLARKKYVSSISVSVKVIDFGENFKAWGQLRLALSGRVFRLDRLET